MTAPVTAPPPAPTDAELLDALRPAFNGTIASLRRRPIHYASSFALEELHLCLDDGTAATLVFKDLTWERLLDSARKHKPWFLYEPRRSVDTHRRVLAPEGIGPRCYAAIAEPERSRYWLFLEKVPGPRIGKLADFGVWEETARWLARLHARFAGRVGDVRAANPFLLDYGAELYLLWRGRALHALGGSSDARAKPLARRLERYDDAAHTLGALPCTFVHGEFYPSNVLVDRTTSEPRICPVDWEVAGTGPGLLDLAAFSGGKWDGSQREELLSIYRAALLDLDVDVASPEEMRVDFDRCRLQLAVQWLGWSMGYRAPPGRAHDWLGEALALARQLDL